MPESYVSTACRSDQHADCASHPVVHCACGCHEGRWPWVERRKVRQVGGAGPSVQRRRRDDANG